VRRVGAGDFSGPLLLCGHDELDELAAGLNTMCAQLDEARAQVRTETQARIAALEQLRHADRLGTLGALAAGLAHELGAPLYVIAGYADLIAARSLSPEQAAASAQTIRRLEASTHISERAGIDYYVTGYTQKVREIPVRRRNIAHNPEVDGHIGNEQRKHRPRHGPSGGMDVDDLPAQSSVSTVADPTHNRDSRTLNRH